MEDHLPVPSSQEASMGDCSKGNPPVAEMGFCSSFSSSSLVVPASSSSSSPSSRQKKVAGLLLRRRRRRRREEISSLGSGGGDDFRDLALPLGMSFAAVVSQVLDGKNVGGETIQPSRLSKICSLAVKEAVEDVYGRRFDKFMGNFQKSFSSTLKTLQAIKEEPFEAVNEICPPIDPPCSQLVIREALPNELGQPTRLSESALTAFERSVMEQARSNDLKAFEISLSMEKLKLKKSQLYLSSYSNFLEKVKISMGIEKSTFREEKFKTQIRDSKHAELVKTCLDLLIAGLIMMSCLLIYGAYAFSYKRISEATSSCNSLVKESKSWWVPKQVSSFNSGLLSLRCQVVVISRMCFGILMILSVAYSGFLRSTASGSTMPVTFIIISLGVVCGIAGKFCVDTLGGSGNTWLFYWEMLCLLHFWVNAFPSSLYQILNGPIAISSKHQKLLMLYWIRKSAFYGALVLVLPLLSGLMPFASFYDWKEHIVAKLWPWSQGVEG